MIKDIFWLLKKPGCWTRLAAKGIDYGLFFISCSFISLFLPFYIPEIYYILFALCTPFLFMPVEALLIAILGTTAGKKIFRIQVKNHVGGRLPFWIALKRSILLGIRPGLIKQKTLSLRRKILGGLVCFAILTGAAFEQEIADFGTGYTKTYSIEGWRSYTSQDGNFRVLFPSDPQQEFKEIPLPEQNRVLNYNELKSFQDKKVYYSVSYMQLPREWKLAGSSRVLQGALEGIVEHCDGVKLISKSYTKHGSYRALDFHYEQEGEEVQGRFIMVGTTLYRLTVTYPPSYAQKMQSQEFISSFEVQS
ncbi:MAG: hypothetical protein EBZ47_03530 [Chlamydiae bacterium]|nr:hypothetical protein [Chlamydiota bacterium]